VIGTNANVAQLLQELSGRDVDTAKDDEYDTVFVISVPTFGDANVLRMKY
jgi:hypothetical protein